MNIGNKIGYNARQNARIQIGQNVGNLIGFNAGQNAKNLIGLANIELQVEEFDLMVVVVDCEEIEEVNANYGSTEDNSNVNPKNSSMDLRGGDVEQLPATLEETRPFYESLYNNLVIKVEKVNTVNRKTREANEKLTAELA
ncbi:hypothetical protein Tco_0965483, partial [Tanacetum coccineum]